ncbi:MULTISPECIES: hypothetical protein [unclassified Streptomyces]|uniref:hypothetical protein n=1 Tax=unclassified Streptomyces TaxID=2593676 RepID=UPI002DDABF74|nr:MULTISPECIES: hypothetical protein [unclassified Streptomyces]WSF85218.1 hypothetical protein OIE70_20185 [Streptomyces sp. NBC_01744]WSC38491.1 hypothetical protein OHA08_24990 [Streptomyces sp. NBC_01763]WSC46628.1 hypothetical protein OIE61_23260 [Streptomyces sp. NBC_01762]WSC54379.1 hypothetical protein OG808_20085 [Streptomyces sp. NBC_01761]WSD26280.1 hypothetical protein OHA26_23950 [Streptomyces sp. NBC_01751]
MTQSGQGDEQLPAVRPTHEGVVLPAGGGEPWIPGGAADQAAPAGGQPWGQPWGPQASQGQYDRGQYDQQQGQYEQQQGQYGQGGQYEQQGQYGQEPPYGQQPQGQPLPQPYAQPLPPEVVPGMGAGADADATQYIAPVPAGLPPESPAEATQFLAHTQPAPASDADATQYIPPVPGGAPYSIRPGTPGERQPPAEFDNLFRSEEPAGATQQMPRFDPGQAAPPYRGAQQPPFQPQQPQHSEPPQGRAGQRKKPSHVPLIAAVVVGCAIIGLGAGALMSGDDKGKDDKQPVAAASSPAAKPSTQAAADPAKPQAEALDKLLADSNNSRSAVIGAVEKTKSCTDLDQAVTDLQGAAQQRRELVTRLQGLSVDKLPDHAQLTEALTKAWQASASADDHYAAWARQAKNGKKVCRHGKARATSETAQATVASGEASKAKQRASGLWNSIATKYGLTRRSSTDL